MGRPVIGVTSAPRIAQVAEMELPVEAVTEQYLQTLIRAGASPIVLPVHGTTPGEVFPRLDGIALTGGGDVDPSLYGKEPRPETYGVDRERDSFEVDLIRKAVDVDLPLIAICRGIQMLNVALGGTLTQDIGAELESPVDHRQRGHWEEPSHDVRIDPASTLGQVIGDGVAVNSMHHQAVERPAPGLRAVAWAPDGVIEAVEAEGLRFCLGLQWHPEYLGPKHPTFRVLEAFVRAASQGPA